MLLLLLCTRSETWLPRKSADEGTVTVSIDTAYDKSGMDGWMPCFSLYHTWIWPFHVLKLQKHVDSYWL
ncbi:hypothetical protein OIU79_021840 [Salix purpurea]|uniref:Uncharacterized protein n=1 Tax=Salix purpurea TaxID=77065 RepID=A0A9Q1AC39_SALPP|nr:hypothetical protein OIU79_021840 [Salix purpurea]